DRSTLRSRPNEQLRHRPPRRSNRSSPSFRAATVAALKKEPRPHAPRLLALLLSYRLLWLPQYPRSEAVMFVGQLSLIAAALFAGAAIYVNVAEQPARLDLGDGAPLTVWKSAYKRGFAVQAPLALVGSILGLLAAWQTKDLLWLFGTIILLANWP